MEYTKTSNQLKTIFNITDEEISIPDSDIEIHNIGFRSDIPLDGFSNENDIQISENHSFRYPVFAPRTIKNNKAILLLHGLNERSWLKYLAWAYYLAEKTGSYIILFPISFHINRSPVSWKDPRVMIPVMKDRNSAFGEINMSSFANIAISNRLADDPMRFFNSGYQTSYDIIKLLSTIRNGKHKIIPGNCTINVFAYSIGAFLAEILLMGNPENLFSDSKLFIFCGGSVFSNMHGASKLIMDTRAFDKVYNYFLNDFEKSISGKGPLVEFLRSSQLGMAFRSMIDLGRFKTFRENILQKLKDQIYTISLQKDTVIPWKGVIATLGNSQKRPIVDVWDFPYTYSHENPFPVLDFPLSKKVDDCFEKVFSEAQLFLG